MPSGPPELHEKWSNYYPEGFGDQNAMRFLREAGFKLTDGWTWIAPGREPTEEEWSAINYLVWEWDFGGLEDA